ncbi:MAG: hypothetical protein Q8M29_08700 [Bacteroidota bacterium]|nr:hypothetical protein [Bacteroidota bacterium]
MISKKLLITLLALFGLGLKAQVGLNCQFVPGLQLGAVTVKSDNSKIGEYKAAAGLPVFMLDRLKNKWYAQLDMNGLYYSVTQYNKSQRSKGDSTKYAKTEGGLCAGRIGYGFGKSETMRVGPNLNIGYMMSNINGNKRSFEGMPMYWNFGGGVFFYQKIGTKIRAMAKVGYEKYSNKKASSDIATLKGSGTYFEATVAYNIYQKYGVAVMPALYSKKFTYNYNGETTETKTKVKSVVLRIGFTKFF